ncbi:pullulanase-type alpha-1,6-glucosidase [Arenicella xantha]|uniref:Pullulanase-type alpha-1,6-glucosidase n=1 Tax=Arenicella xantha TaxID=644221 RepID=A0A395JK30_9GAMM|nr:pullulanase-type alpha-1,6-glucosidase [Arenicella xantha]RBP47061.1 pullulanase-type alpha-1,6-glucosidase [Arenicella xantha]
MDTTLMDTASTATAPIERSFTLRTLSACKTVLASTFFVGAMVTAPLGFSADTPDPTVVAIPGSFQASLGCSGDWQPDCSATYLTLNATADVWQATFSLSAGAYEYKAALNNSWDENYGQNAARNGPNLQLSLDVPSDVSFYYDHASHWVTDSLSARIAIAAGDFQQALGCSGNWQPDCLNSWLKDPDGDGVYTLISTAITAGDYQAKVTINQSWDENYGDGGYPNGANIAFTVPHDNAAMYFSFDSASNKLSITVGGAPAGDLATARAHWLDANTIAWDTPIADGDVLVLHASADASLALTPDGVTGGSDYPVLVAGSLSPAVQEKFRHLSAYSAFSIATLDDTTRRQLLKSQLAISVMDAQGNLKDATSIQTPGALDALFQYDGQLGPVVNEHSVAAHVWAPTAQNVELLLFDSSEQTEPSQILPMTENSETGVWSATDIGDWNRKFYQYRVTVYTKITRAIEVNDVTDPYSLSLAENSRLSQFVDLADSDLKPRGWNHLAKPRLRAPEDITIYELHVRDFSISDESVAAAERGTFKAFTRNRSRGMRHLRQLANAGLSHIHLLPAFDIASVDENRDQQVAIADDLSAYAPDSAVQQQAVADVQNQDGFNWGYDPLHFNVPEGSYSTDPDGVQRIVEFREMVKNLNRRGLRVVMDVVYNHTSSFGQFDQSVLDKIVPQYYHRYNADGDLEMSTCCANTATEHRMMEKLMIDSLLVWAKAYKVDGFRFDIMGHHSKQNILAVRAALDALTMADDGVDGKSIYLYGEGWNFGEVANNARFEQATQLNMAGTGIGSFDDRGRDAIRGGNPFGGYRDQGFGTGLHTNPNGFGDDRFSELMVLADRTRSSLTGGLKDYAFETHTGEVLSASEIDYSGLPTGYTEDPQEQIAYIAAHDNETLLDGIQLKAPASATIADRARMQNFSTSLVMLGQGIPFIHAGQEFLRSKSMDRDSYNSGDWFNAIDWTFNESGWGKGLPIAEKNEDKWSIMAPLLANPDLKPTPWLQYQSSRYFRELLNIRYSSSLFRLRDRDSIVEQVSFMNTGPSQTPGLIVMRLKDDSSWWRREVVVLFNGSNQSIEFGNAELDARYYFLHPTQRWSIDAPTRQSRYQQGVFSVPAMTTAVFVGHRGWYH